MKDARTHLLLMTLLAVGLALALAGRALENLQVPMTADAGVPSEAGALVDLIRTIEERGYEEADTERLWEAALEGVVREVDDPYVRLMDEEEYRGFLEDHQSGFGGVGIEMRMIGSAITVLSVLSDSPAEEAGIARGDEILRVDGEATDARALDDVAEQIRGEHGTTVELHVLRSGLEEVMSVELERAEIEVDPVEAARLNDGVVYIELSRFSEDAATALERALDETRVAGEDRVILDLRGNPGGILDETIKAADLFLDEGELIARTRTRSGASEADVREETYESKAADRTRGAEIIVLIDEYTASGGEILAGALQDHGRARVLGTQSYGKGSVQSILDVGAHHHLRLTTGAWYTPDGREIEIERGPLGQPAREMPDPEEPGQAPSPSSRPDGGILPDEEILRPDPSETEAEILRAAHEAGLDIRERVHEFTWERRDSLGGDPAPETLRPSGAEFQEFRGDMVEAGLDEEVVDGARPFLEWKMAVATANQMGRLDLELLLRSERDPLLSEALGDEAP